jgi:hypothetical protein
MTLFFRSRLAIRRPRIVLSCLLMILALPQLCAASSRSIVYSKQRIHGVVAHVVTIDLNDLDVRLTPAIARKGVGSSESFSSIVGRTRPTAAITGAFFDTRSLQPVGDVVVDGAMVCRGVVGTAIGIGWNNEVEFVPTKRGKLCDWSLYQSVIVGGPALVSGGMVSVNPRDEGFRDKRLFRKGIRTAIGITSSNKLLFVTTAQPVYLSHLAKIMRSLGARNAATLDGGGSTALYYRGRYIARPDRRLTTLLLAYDHLSDYEQARNGLLPRRPVTAGRPVTKG